MGDEAMHSKHCTLPAPPKTSEQRRYEPLCARTHIQAHPNTMCTAPSTQDCIHSTARPTCQVAALAAHIGQIGQLKLLQDLHSEGGRGVGWGWGGG